MKMVIITISVSLVLLLGSLTAFACPLKIANDNKLNVLLFDWHNNKIVFLKSGSSAVIDPTVYGWKKHFKKEKFDLFYQEKVNSFQYLRRYQVIENYCVDDPAKNQLRISQFDHFLRQENKRFTVKQIKYRKTARRHMENHEH